MLLPDAISAALGTAEPLLTRIEALDERALVCRPYVDNWQVIARTLSSHLPGQVWPSRHGLTVVAGRTVEYLVDDREYREIIRARDLAAALGVQVGWGYGSASRRLLAWTGLWDPGSPGAEAWLSDTGWQYKLCRPGHYEHLALHDMQSAYYRLTCHLRTPYPCPHERGVLWRQAEPTASSRWRDVLEAIGAHKALRNTLIGCMAGGPPRASGGVVIEVSPSRSPGLRAPGAYTYYHRGAARTLRLQPGPLRPAALLVVRTAWELCQHAAITRDAVYANVDCVATPDNTPPPVWAALGVARAPSAEGEADIVGCGVWRIGEKRTRWYGRTDGHTCETVGPCVPKRLWARAWLPVPML